MVRQRRLFRDMVAGATLIQSVVRMKITRSQFLKRREAVSKIQSWLRNIQVGREQRTRYIVMRRAAIQIQHQWRLCRYRRAVARRLEQVRVCQKAVRGFLARRILRRLREEARRQRAAVLIQAAVRAVLQRKKYVKMRDSAILLQRWIRWTFDSIRLTEEFNRMKGTYRSVLH
jgi:myosin heavy subunit